MTQAVGFWFVFSWGDGLIANKSPPRGFDPIRLDGKDYKYAFNFHDLLRLRAMQSCWR